VIGWILRGPDECTEKTKCCRLKQFASHNHSPLQEQKQLVVRSGNGWTYMPLHFSKLVQGRVWGSSQWLGLMRSA
jgi:hypothetical protein